MPNRELIIDDTENIDHSPHMPEVHAVLLVIIGTTMAELLPILSAQLIGLADLVPWRAILVDSLPYEDVGARLVQNGWTRNQVVEAIPRAQYFHLTSPFSENFDFDNPLNRAWLSTIFEPSLRRLAAKPNAPGCAGTPALGRVRVEGNAQDLREFFERHLQALTQVRTETLALLEGVKVFVITTYRGGTGTGAATTAAAVLRSVMGGGQIHCHAVMPCVYLGDDRAYANAYAMLRENQSYHRYGGGVPMKGDRLLKAPFDTTTYIFASNGAVALGPMDALMQEAALLRAYLRTPTQAAINARHVDCTDVVPYDMQDQPMHVRVETALSIQTMQPGTQEYLVTQWLRQELEAVQQRFEAWVHDGTLTGEEESRVTAAVETALKHLNLHPGALLARLDPSPTPANTLRAFFEQATGGIGNMKAHAIKEGMAGLPTRVRDAFGKFEAAWEERTLSLAMALPRQVTDDVISQLAASPHLALAALGRIGDHFAGWAREAMQEAEQEKRKRDAAGAQLGSALNAVQESRGLFGFIHADEVTRDAALHACGIALTAAMARVQQQRLEYLVQALQGEMSVRDSWGKPASIRSVTATLRHIQLEQVAAVRTRQAAQLAVLQARLDGLGQAIEKRSQVFQRSLLYDGMDREQLDAEVRAIRARVPHAPPIVDFLEGKQDLQRVCADLLPLLPSYADSGRSLMEMLASDPARERLVVQLLRSRRPFTSLDREVEDQQGLRNRRDTLVILEVPGGQDGPLAQLMLREGIVTHLNQVVDAGDHEIRLYTLRDGLPYAAIQPLAKYQERHDSYVYNPAAIPPYTLPNAHQLPRIEPARSNPLAHTQALLSLGQVMLPHRLAHRPSGGFILRYEVGAGNGFRPIQEASFPDATSLTAWVAKRVEIRKSLEAELKRRLDEHPDTCRDVLMAAWQQAVGAQREHLYAALCTLQIDPASVLLAEPGNQQPTTNSTPAAEGRARTRRKGG